MKVTRSLPHDWTDAIPRERKAAMVSFLVLLTLLGLAMAYERYQTARRSSVPQPVVSETLPAPVPAASAGVEEAPPAQPQPIRPEALTVPLAGEPKVIRPYAFAYSEAYGDYRLHPGIDYQAAPGSDVLAAGRGTVVSVDQDPAEGTMLTIDHGSGLMTRYGGLGRIHVDPNETVEAGQKIGTVGSHRTTGGRLHFEIVINGDPKDPAAYIRN